MLYQQPEYTHYGAFTIRELKREMNIFSSPIKRKVDNAAPHSITRLEMKLPNNCYPTSAKLFIEPWRGGYRMVLDPYIKYWGKNPDLRKLCEQDCVEFYSWCSLTDFIRGLPNWG